MPCQVKKEAQRESHVCRREGNLPPSAPYPFFTFLFKAVEAKEKEACWRRGLGRPACQCPAPPSPDHRDLSLRQPADASSSSPQLPQCKNAFLSVVQKGAKCREFCKNQHHKRERREREEKACPCPHVCASLFSQPGLPVPVCLSHPPAFSGIETR